MKLALILEVAGILLLFAGFVLPLWVYLTLLTIALIIAGYSIYAEDQEKLDAIKAEYEEKLAERDRHISELLAQQPLLELGFMIDGQLHKRHTFYAGGLPEPPDIERLVQEESEDLKRAFDESAADENPGTLDIVRRLSSVGLKKELSDYEKECGEYLNSYRRYLLNAYDHEVFATRLRRINLAVSNNGIIPAEDVTVFLDFPDEFKFPTDGETWINWEISKEAPNRPPQPNVYISGKSNFGTSWVNASPLLAEVGAGIGTYERPSVRGPYYTSKNSTEVKFEIDQLMHNFVQELDEVEFKLGEDAIGKEWEIGYGVHAGNLPNPVRAYLYIEIVQQDSK